MNRSKTFAFAPLRAAAVLALLGAGIAAPASAAPWCGNRCDQVVLDWNQATHQVIKAADGYKNPLAASRALAMTHLAMHDAVNAVSPRYAPYAVEAKAAPRPGHAKADEGLAAVAAVTAAHDVLLALYPGQKDLLRATLDVTMLDAGKGRAVADAVATGKQAAAAVIAKRAEDGSGGTAEFREGTQPGEYRFVPGTNFLFAAHWRGVTPFALRSASQFRVAPPPALDSREYARDFEEVKTTGGDTAAQRSADQGHYAAFWYEFSDSGWNRIARVVSRDQRQNLWERARLFALLNAAMADAYVAGWDSKLHHNFWRPVTAIHEAARDGNPATQPDTTWKTLLPTPPIQDHPSTHSALGAAAAAVLAHGFGRDDVKFSFTSPTAVSENPERSFSSFSQAARENADSRVRAGLHFRFATTAGLDLGHKIGRFTVSNLLAPLH